MSEKCEERCSHCADAVAKYGEGYHRVHMHKGRPRCEGCGAALIDGEWIFRCKTCGKVVDKLFGLFVPHNCESCHKALIERQRRTGQVCGLCRQPLALCCC